MNFDKKFNGNTFSIIFDEKQHFYGNEIIIDSGKCDM